MKLNEITKDEFLAQLKDPVKVKMDTAREIIIDHILARDPTNIKINVTDSLLIERFDIYIIKIEWPLSQLHITRDEKDKVLGYATRELQKDKFYRRVKLEQHTPITWRVLIMF